MPLINEARNHLYEMQDALKRRLHSLAIELDYSNPVIAALKSGKDVYWTPFSDGEGYLTVDNQTAYGFKYADEYHASEKESLINDLNTALDYGLIEEDDTESDNRETRFRLVP